MSIRHTPTSLAIAVAFAIGMVSPRVVQAQDKPQTRPAAPAATVKRGGSSLGMDLFGGAGVTWPTATKSFDAVGLGSTLVEFGGGARVTGIWRTLFLQAGAARWSDTGERAFVDSTGTVFPLGIPLSVKATYVDVSVGSKAGFRARGGKTAMWSYVAIGAGFVKYSERSPFAQPGDDFDTRAASYHVLGGVEIPLVKWLAVTVDGRYRFIPDVLNKGGVSAALREKTLGGVQVNVGLRIGFGGAPPPSRVPPRRAPAAERPRLPAGPPPGPPADMGLILEPAPVYLLPDTRRTPLRTLPAKTGVTILEQTPEWIRIRFTDPQYGQRVGYVQRKFVQIKNEHAP